MANEEGKVKDFFTGLFKENSEKLEKELEDQMQESTAELYNTLDAKVVSIKEELDDYVQNIKALLVVFKKELILEIEKEVFKPKQRSNLWFWIK